MGQCCRNRREREKEQRKQDIMDAALSLFSRRGFHHVSMQEVAEASGFAVGTLYNFFANKEDLFNELRKRSKGWVLDELRGALHGEGSPVECLRHMIRYQPVILERHGEFLRLYVAEMGQRANKLCAAEPDDRDFHDVIETEMAQVIQAGIDQGYFRRVDARITAKALISTLETLAFEGVDSLRQESEQGAYRQVEALFIDGLLITGDTSDHA